NVQQVLTHINDLADAHTSAIEGVHGILIGTSGTGYVNAYSIETNAVVGRLDPQVVENKRLVAPYQGTKIVLFSDVVEDLEKEIFAPFHNPQNTDSRIIIRKPSASRITTTFSATSLLSASITDVSRTSNVVTIHHTGSSYSFIVGQ